MAFLPATGGIIQALRDTSELVELFKPSGLYLKPVARMNISVKLPLLKDPGQAISNWDLMERIKKLIYPLHFSSIKVSKSTMEFVRFEAELNNREHLAKAIKVVDNASLKVIGFFETLKVRAAEAKSEFPVRHDWDAFFRDAKNMNELHPGERPDTIYLAYLPCRWFSDGRHKSSKDEATKDLPSEFILRRIFETFGEVRCVDIPMTDPYRAQMSRTGMRCSGFRFGGEVTFEAYVQFNEYISFVKAMDALRNMKLVHLDADSKTFSASIKVDFDKSKHLSDKSIRRRRLEGERLAKIDNDRKAREAAEKAKIEAKLAEVEKEKTGRRAQREEKRRIKYLDRKRMEEEKAIERKILLEERKLVVAERKLESMRLLAELFVRLKDVKIADVAEKVKEEMDEADLEEKEMREKLLRKKEEKERRGKLLKKREKTLKKKMAKKLKEREVHSNEEGSEYGSRRKGRKRILDSRSTNDLQSVVASSSYYTYEPRLKYEDAEDLTADYRDYQTLDEYRHNERSSPPPSEGHGRDVYLAKNHGYAGWRNVEPRKPPPHSKALNRDMDYKQHHDERPDYGQPESEYRREESEYRREQREIRSESRGRDRGYSRERYQRRRSPRRDRRSPSPPRKMRAPSVRPPLGPKTGTIYGDRWMDIGIPTIRPLDIPGQNNVTLYTDQEPGEVAGAKGADFDSELAEYRSMAQIVIG